MEDTGRNASSAGRDGRRGPGSGQGRGNRRGGRDRVLFRGEAVDAERCARVVCCVDDTDDLSAETSTGYVAELIADAIIAMGGFIELGITRHQLLLAPGVPYTSHNSAMAFVALVPRGCEKTLRRRAIELLAENCAESADPGLCICVLPTELRPCERDSLRAIVAFGHEAKTRVCTKDEAYALAARLPWVTLSEHGGTGQGVVGALAGAGLRLEGADGRFRGKWNLAAILGDESGARHVAARHVCTRLGALVGGDVRVVYDGGRDVPAELPIELTHDAKPMLHEGALTFVVETREGVGHPYAKIDLGDIGSGGTWSHACELFEPDNDAEECMGSEARSCANCLFRRMTDRGFACVVTMPAMARA